MPVVLRVKGYRSGFSLWIGTNRRTCKNGREAKFWIEPLVRLSQNKGLRPHEMTEVQRIILEYQEHLLEAWRVFFRR
jgi:hypothetical protein